MSSLHPGLPDVSPYRRFWLLLSIGIILAAEIAAICSLAFLFLPEYMANLARPSFPSFIGSLSPFLVTAPLAGLSAGLPTWWLIIVRSGRATIRRGVVVGILSSTIAHPIMWTSLALLAPILGGISGSLGLSYSFLNISVYSLVSILFTGWITTAIGSVAGILLVRLQNQQIQL